MATIPNPTVRPGAFLTIDDVNKIFESTRESGDLISDLQSSTQVSSGSSLWGSSATDTTGSDGSVHSGTSLSESGVCEEESLEGDKLWGLPSMT